MPDFLVVTQENGRVRLAIYPEAPPNWWPKREQLYGPGGAFMRELKPGESDLSFEELRRRWIEDKRALPVMPGTVIEGRPLAAGAMFFPMETVLDWLQWPMTCFCGPVVMKKHRVILTREGLWIEPMTQPKQPEAR